jgi:hypothetical protein
MRVHRLIIGVFLLVMLATSHAESVGPDSQRGEWNLLLAPALKDFSYKELDTSGDLLDREDGVAPGVILGLSREWRDLFFAVDFSYYGGDVDYDGQTQSGIPITTQTNAQFSDVSFRAERRQRTATGRAYGTYVGLGYHEWVRDIESTRTTGGAFVQGLLETYTWWTAELGARISLYQAGAGRWQLDARFLYTLDPSVEVDSHGLFDRTTLEPAGRPGFRVALPWEYGAKGQATGFIVEPWVEYYEFGESDKETITSGGTPVGTAFEPRSETRNFGVSAGILRRF